MLRLLPLLLCALLAPVAAQAQQPLTHCGDVRGLTREQAAEMRPVEVSGVVTFVMSDDAEAFVIQDDTDAIYVTRKPRGGGRVPLLEGLKVGVRTRLRGITGPGGFAPVLIASEVKVEGPDELRPAPEQTLTQLRTGVLDCHRVQMRGVAQRVERLGGKRRQIRIQLAALDGSFSAYVADFGALDEDQLVDAELRLTGVCFTLFNPRGEAVGVHLQVASANDLVIEQPAAPDPFAVPEAPALALRPFARTPPTLHRKRLEGVVTLSRPGEFIYVQTAQRGFRVNTRTAEPIEPRDRVEASGFVAATHGFGVLDEALVRRVGRGPLPAPIPITPAEVFAVSSLRTDVLRQEDYDGQPVRLRGRLLKIESNAGEPHRIFLDAGGAIIVATAGAQLASSDFDRFAPGSDIEATGICAVRLSDRWPALVIPVPESFTLLLQSPDSLRVLRVPSWWTPQRLWIALGITGAVLAAALAWVWTLRRRVARRSEALAAEMRARRDAAVEFETTLRERTRLAADLHDTLEQSLTGLALQLEAADALHTEAPDRSERHLGLARQLLDRSREDVRRSVWNLRANPLEGATLVETLRSIAADRSAGLAVRISVESEGDPQPLSDFVAGNLLLLTQEAITNALKHAAPTEITLRVAFGADEVTLCITDDGRGFAVADSPGPREGHFGLQGMRERAKRLGALLEVKSAPGAGTAITVRLRVHAG